MKKLNMLEIIFLPEFRRERALSRGITQSLQIVKVPNSGVVQGVDPAPQSLKCADRECWPKISVTGNFLFQFLKAET